MPEADADSRDPHWTAQNDRLRMLIERALFHNAAAAGGEILGIFSSTGQEAKAYDFTGWVWTYPELASVLTDLRGSPVAYREVDHDEGIVAMLGIGPFIRSGAFERQTGDLEQVLGHPPMSLLDAVSVTLTQAGQFPLSRR